MASVYPLLKERPRHSGRGRRSNQDEVAGSPGLPGTLCTRQIYCSPSWLWGSVCDDAALPCWASHLTRGRQTTMPPRRACVAIVACWLGTNGWLLGGLSCRTLQPGQPPPFTVDLVEEVQLRPASPDLLDRLGTAKRSATGRRPGSSGEQRPSELKVLHLRVTPYSPAGKPLPSTGGAVRSMTSRWRHPAPQLRSLDAEVVGLPLYRGALASCPRRGARTITSSATTTSAVESTGDLDPAPVRTTMRCSCPSTPCRLPGAVPRTDLRGAVPDAAGPWRRRRQARFRRAGVARTANPLLERQGSPCLVIEYADGDQKSQTWVAQDSRLVLRQDASVGTEHWVPGGIARTITV